MKTLFYLLSLAISLIFFNNSHAQMRQLSLDAADADNEAQKFSFYSPSEGYVAFTRWIGYTTDSGRTFTHKDITLGNVNYNGYPVNLTFGFGIKGVKAFNQDTIIVYGDYGFVPAILYSTDKGNTFKLIYHDRYDVFSFKTGITDMVFPEDHTTGYAVEADRILKTTNKGVSWSVIRTDVDRYFDYLEAVDNNNVFAFSTKFASSKLFKTSNGGTTWTAVTVPAGQIVYSQFLTASKGWLIMKNDDQQGVVYYTSNGGGTWTQKNDAVITPFYGYKFKFVNDSTGYSLAGLYGVYKTTDSGKIWQPLPRDNSYSYLGYSHNDLQLYNANQLWAGGGHGFIEINTNAGGNPLPKAFFKTDTSGVAVSNIVKLVNYSKPNYQYKWFKNDTLISTAYNTSFTHDQFKFRDTIALVVSDGTHTDTLVQYMEYAKVWITSFTPNSAAEGNIVAITGYNFTTTFQVHFGGVQARSFTVVSDTLITAVVSWGSSGDVEVFTLSGSAARGGFTFLGPPKVDLPASISDSILCKSESTTITIHNTEPGVIYELIPWMGLQPYAGTGYGNGGTISFTTIPISESWQYRIRVRRAGNSGGSVFSTYFNIIVEHTVARFTADQINITTGETVTYAGQAGEAKDFLWTFYEDASIPNATGVKTPAISYAGSGQKSLRLIAISENGCRDTAVGRSVFVYSAPAGDASCVINPLDSTGAKGMAMTQVMNSYDDGTFVIGATNDARKLKSRIGVAKEFGPGNHSFFAKYNSNSVLKWAHYFRPGAGGFTAGQTDAQGNIYLTGYAVSTQWLHFANGDSMQFYGTPLDTTYMGERINGFILKLDRDGNHLWHTILQDHITLWQGYAANATGTHIAIKDDHIIVIGSFFSKLSYVHNGVVQPLYEVPSGYREHDNHVVLKIKNDGTLLWHALLNFHANNWHSLADVSIDKNGNSYLVGTYEEYLGITDADSVQSVQLNGVVAYHKAFMVKFDVNGKVKWHNNFVSSYEYGNAQLDKVVADDDGSTYVAGSMFNWGSPVTISITHSDGTVAKDSLAAFALYKFDANGKRRWGVGSRYPYYGGSSAMYLKGNEIYVAGQLSNNGVEISSFLLSSTDGKNRPLVINQGECFIVKYDTTGVFKRVFTSGYNYLANSVSPTSLYTNSKGQFILGGNAGTFQTGVLNGMFNIPWPQPWLGGSDGFFTKLQADFCQASLTANAGPDKLGCAGDTVSIGTRQSGDIYSWTSNPAGFTSDLSSPLPRPKVNTTYYFKVTNETGVIAYDTVFVSVRPSPIADAGPDTVICSSHSTLIGTPEIAGNTYQWYNMPPYGPFGSGTAQVIVSPYFNTSYYVRVVGPNDCPAYDTINVKILDNFSPEVNIETAKTTVCEEDMVEFTATAQDVGTTLSYQWQIEGVNAGTNSTKFSTNTIKNGEKVWVVVTHNYRCSPSPQSNSNGITMTITDKITPSVNIAGNTTVDDGQTAFINATLVNQGSGPQVKWQDSTASHSWQNLTPPPSLTAYPYKPLKTGDKIRAILTVSETCVTASSDTSIDLSFIVNKVTGIEPEPAAKYGLIYYPNPTPTTLTIDSLRIQDQWQQLAITSIDGRQTFIRVNVANRTRVQVPVAALGRGMYVAILRNRNGLATYLKFMKL